jgi:hypothetical protein
MTNCYSRAKLIIRARYVEGKIKEINQKVISTLSGIHIKGLGTNVLFVRKSSCLVILHTETKEYARLT